MTDCTLPMLLAPAGGMEALTAAVRCGADAVYVGARQFSARANAENFDAEELRQAAALCHLYGAKLYLTVNTLLFDTELSALDPLLQTAAEIGADACIVQDLGVAAYIRRRLPTMRLHASTQMTVHTPAGIRFAKRMGFRRVVLARELSREQIAVLCRTAADCDMEVEVFIHGAHCMSVSGQCWMSAAMGGRSANRGCCAQPCRLPFSAEPAQSEAYALSLRDQSLLAHIAELRSLGVHALKIEGRMKRPEYVAAAVTACRRALANGQPDTEELRAVFSRSGFTDGYYTGSRAEMFGIRQKEDVLAAQTVLQSIRTRYQKPRKTSVLDGSYALAAGTPSRLTVTDAEGHCVTVTGEIPQTAAHRPTDAEQLRRQFEKLGDTIYTAGTVTAELEDGLMLPASSLNALRRAAVSEMDACRIAANTPQHRLAAETPQINSAKATREHPPRFRLQIRRLEQLSALASDADALDALLLPLHLLPEYRRSAQIVPPERCILVLPRFICDEHAVAELLTAAHRAGYTHLACQQAGDLELGSVLGFTLHGTLGLHVTNSLAAAELTAFGAADALISPETPRSVLPVQTLPLGMLAYGRLPLMLTRNCPIRAQVGCAACSHRLVDRKGESVYTDCTRYTDNPDYAELFNAVPVWLADTPQVYQNTAYALLYMTDEPAERVREITAVYVRGQQTVPPDRFTRGLRLRNAAGS